MGPAAWPLLVSVLICAHLNVLDDVAPMFQFAAIVLQSLAILDSYPPEPILIPPGTSHRRAKRLLAAALVANNNKWLNSICPPPKRQRRFWSMREGMGGMGSFGAWEKQQAGDWPRVGRVISCPTLIDEQYVVTYRMDSTTFNAIVRLYGGYFEKRDTRLRSCVPAHKRLAITLDWLASGAPLRSIAGKYDVGKATAGAITVSVVRALWRHMVPVEVRIPSAGEMQNVIADFESLCWLPGCAGALDGTFMHISRPKKWGDAYYCYKKFYSILILALVDAHGFFRYVNSGEAGSMGDAFVWTTSVLRRSINNGEVMQLPDGAQPLVINGTTIKPYIAVPARHSSGKLPWAIT